MPQAVLVLRSLPLTRLPVSDLLCVARTPHHHHHHHHLTSYLCDEAHTRIPTRNHHTPNSSMYTQQYNGKRRTEQIKSNQTTPPRQQLKPCLPSKTSETQRWCSLVYT
ncbi:hypothetical protein BO70DRAFT_357221 [Aspergillus heteromorphus CBS 117.55]|uniref:Uncharacterized protein n=1 Tax=Aspergillus heteromorphus CBS 117.55 TaxID=1448321 RepID=A0A317X370_9EURO|nr:uncharacterized protein BO70DRAFT_357221 [Aspergillus heteromorphus CBS 117.55]PWY92072.1 hypothetical protein BO70DRAFT_357221 [Aspergillus heteromorphus CBS 117.55]